MPQSALSPRICRDCDGFATVAIDTGARTPNGARITLRVDCPTCHGAGTVTANAAQLTGDRA